MLVGELCVGLVSIYLGKKSIIFFFLRDKDNFWFL